jgi:glycosyltransferase involved in cell wall biosynthesis
MITVGTSRAGEGEHRNVASLPFREVEIVPTRDLAGIPFAIGEKLFQRSMGRSFWGGFFWDGGLNRVDLHHLYNRISAPPRPWVTTFDYLLPHWNHQSRFGLHMLAGSSCRKIIATSDFAFRVQADRLYSFPDYREEILDKMCILHPSQPLLLRNPDEKEVPSRVVSVVFAQKQFFRLGGREVLLAVRRLMQERFPIHLTVVSSLEAGDTVSQTTERDVRSAERLIADLYPHVTVHTTLSPPTITELLRRAHAALVPAYFEPYGYTMLEAQATATPVVTTDVCAFPETNDESVGWLIHVPRKPSGEAFLSSAEQRRGLSETIQEQLYRVLKDICRNPEKALVKGRAAWERVRDFHAPADRAAWLTALYKEILAGR